MTSSTAHESSQQVFVRRAAALVAVGTGEHVPEPPSLLGRQDCGPQGGRIDSGARPSLLVVRGALRPELALAAKGRTVQQALKVARRPFAATAGLNAASFPVERYTADAFTAEDPRRRLLGEVGLSGD